MSDRKRYLVYDGPSCFDGAPIVALLTLGSSNTKTGPIPQLFVLPRDTDPREAVKLGCDGATCGDCPFRSGHGCYVQVGRGGALELWRAYHRGSFYRLPAHIQAARGAVQRAGGYIRLSAYGDPAAVPLDVLEGLLATLGARSIGYTHGWRTADPGLALHCMASVETTSDAAIAREMGYRTFRILLPGMEPVAGEFRCPSDRRQCVKCGACDGASRGAARRSPCIEVHGNRNGIGRAIRTLKKLVASA
jgi:hypothetical protein